MLASCLCFGAMLPYPPNIPPKNEPEDLTFLSASAISWIASFSFPELSISSLCRKQSCWKVRNICREFRGVHRGLQEMGLFSVGVPHIADNGAVAWWDIELFTGQNGRPWRTINYKYQWSWKQFLDRLLRNSSWHFNILKNSFCNFLLNFTYRPHLSFSFFIKVKFEKKVKSEFVRHKIPGKKNSVVRLNIQQMTLICSNYEISD